MKCCAAGAVALGLMVASALHGCVATPEAHAPEPPPKGQAMTIGRQFPGEEAVNQIQRHKTTREDVRRLFGEPWRTGVQDGLLTWGYGYYRYGRGKDIARDLVMVFDADGKVLSYAYASTGTGR